MYDVTSAPPVHDTMNDAEVILADKPVGFVGDVRVVVLTAAELVGPVVLTAVTTKL